MPHNTPLQSVHEQRLTSALRMVYLVGDKYTTVAEQTARLGCCLHSLVELLRLSELEIQFMGTFQLPRKSEPEPRHPHSLQRNVSFFTAMADHAIVSNIR